jgi:hypothetical protein
MASWLLSPLKFCPLFFDIFEVFKDDLPDFPMVPGGHVKGKGLLDFERVTFQPVLAFHIPLAAVDMNWFPAFVGVKEKSPPEDHEYGRH